MVVVVVYAMVDKGNEVVSEPVVLKRKKNAYNSNQVEPQIYTSELADLKGQEVIVEVSKRQNSTYETVAEFSGTVYNKEAGITLKTEVVEENDLLPGEQIKVTVFERAVQMKLEDDGSVMGRAKAFSSKANADGVDSRLYCEAVHKRLDRGGQLLKYRNARTGKEATGRAVAHKEKNSISFRQDVRQSIDAQPGDLIEIVENPGNTSDSNNRSEAVAVPAEKIDEMYEMLSQLHEAYTQRQND